MIDVIQEKLEFTVGHTLKIDQIDLTPNTESISDNIFYASNRLLCLHHKNATRAAICEQLAQVTGAGDVIVSLLGPLCKGIALAVIAPCGSCTDLKTPSPSMLAAAA